MRSILNNILHTHGYRLDTSSLRTYLYEVMALINSRPLTGTYIHDTQLDPLTPNHLITMKTRPTPPPPGKFDPEDVYSRKRWRESPTLNTGVLGQMEERIHGLTYSNAINGRRHHEILVWVTLY